MAQNSKIEWCDDTVKRAWIRRVDREGVVHLEGARGAAHWSLCGIPDDAPGGGNEGGSAHGLPGTRFGAWTEERWSTGRGVDCKGCLAVLAHVHAHRVTP